MSYMKAVTRTHSGHPLLSAGGGGGVEPPTKFLKRGGGLIGSQRLEGGC